MTRYRVFFAISCLLLLQTATAMETTRQKEQREAFQKQLDMKFDEVDRKLSNATGRSSRIREESKNEFNQLLVELKKKQEETKRKLRETRAANSRDWERLKFEANAAIEDLNRLYEKLISQPTKT